MQHRRFIASILNRPQLITASAGAAVMHALMPNIALDGFSGPRDAVARNPREYAVSGRIAVIPAVGELVHRGSGMNALSGLTSYSDMQDMLTDALTDPSVTAIMGDFDTPGGEAGGNMDFAEWVRGQRGIKPMIAMVNCQACSGGYSIASAFDEVMISQDGMVGSIGVVTYHADLSKAMADKGVILTYVYAGDRKIDGNPTGPLSDEARAFKEGMVATIYDRFCNVVAVNRGISVQSVIDTQAGIFMGQAAIAAGLADTIATPEDAMVALSTRTAAPGARLLVNRQTGSASMADQNKPAETPPAANPAHPPPRTPPAPSTVPGSGTPAPVIPVEGGEPGALPADVPGDTRRPNPAGSPGFQPEADPVAVAEACSAAGHHSLITPLLRRKASMAVVTAEIARADQIVSIGAQLNAPNMVDPAIAGGVDAATFRAMALNGRASAEPAISTTLPAAAPAAPEAPKVVDSGAINARLREQRAASLARH